MTITIIPEVKAAEVKPAAEWRAAKKSEPLAWDCNGYPRQCRASVLRGTYVVSVRRAYAGLNYFCAEHWVGRKAHEIGTAATEAEAKDLAQRDYDAARGVMIRQ